MCDAISECSHPQKNKSLIEGRKKEEDFPVFVFQNNLIFLFLEIARHSIFIYINAILNG
jgi:hypothetical protein